MSDDKPFAMTFHLADTACQVCGLLDCDHLRPPNMNGDAVDPIELKASMSRFVGMPVRIAGREVADRIAEHITPNLPPLLEVKSVTQDGDRLVITAGPPDQNSAT